MAVVVCPSCRRELQYDTTKCHHCLGLVDPRGRDRRQGLVRGTTLYFDRYTIEEQIGRGGFAITYRVTTQVGAQRVNRVIKEYFPNGFAENQRAPGSNSLVVRPEKMYQFATYSDAFKLEATHMDGLHDIRGVVRFYDFFQENETVYIVMQFVEGQPLSHYVNLQPQRYLQLDDAANIIRQVLRIMSNVYRVPPMDGQHEAGKYFLLHRDLSLGNIMRENDGSVTIIDFGSSRFMYEQLDKSNKAHYTPVEQIENTREQGQYTDVYAIGKMFYYLLCGNWPNDVGNTEWIDNKAKYELPPVRNLRPEIPQIVDDVIKKATQYDYHHRYQTAEDFLKAMMPIGKGGKAGSGKKSPLPAILIGAGAVGVLVAVLVAMNSGKGGEQPVQTTLPPAGDNASSGITDEVIRKFAYVYAEKGAALCTAEDLESAVAKLLNREVVYRVEKGTTWSTIVLNWNGEQRTYYVQNRWLDELSWDEAVEYESLAQTDRNAIITADNHYLQMVSAELVATPVPTSDVTETPTAKPTPASVQIFVKYVDDKGGYLAEDMIEVLRGEDLVIEAGLIAEKYEVPQATTYALKWGENGIPVDANITVQCQPTASPTPPPPANVTVRYINEAGEILAEDKLIVAYEENIFIPRSEVAGYTVQTAAVNPVVHWNQDGTVVQDTFVYRCVPIVEAEEPVVTEVPAPGLVNLGVEQVTLVYGQTMELDPVYQMYEANAWPQLSFDSNGYVTAEQQNGTIRLTGARIGDDQLTIIDDQGVHTLMVHIVPAVKTLSSTQVVLKNLQDVCIIDMVLEENAVINDFRYNGPAGINVVHVDDHLEVSADRYASGTLNITAGGRSFKVSVQMQDAIECVEMYRAPLNALNDRAAWQAVEADEENIHLIFSAASVQGEALLIGPETLSGTMDQVRCSENAVFNAEIGMYQVDLSSGVWQTEGAAPVLLSAGDSQVAVSIYTGEAIENLAWVRQAMREPFAVGSRNEIGLNLYPGVQVLECSAANNGVAAVGFEGEKLSINGMASGDTVVTVVLTNGEVVTLPLSVRQQIGQLKTDLPSTCVGEEIVVQIAVQGEAVEGEFAAALDNECFTIARQTADTIVLRADKVGHSVLTVTDAFGASASIDLRANTTVLGLSKDYVTLQDGEASEVQILLLEGKKLPSNVNIINRVQGLEINQNDTTITLRAESGVNVRGTVVIDVDGEQFPLNVATADRLEGVTVYQAASSARNNPTLWEKLGDLSGGDAEMYFFDQDVAGAFCLIFDVETLSGGREALMASEFLNYDEANDVYYVNLNRAEFTKGEEAIFELGDKSIRALVYTGDVVLNEAEMQRVLEAPLKAGETREIRPSVYNGITVEGCHLYDEKVIEASCKNGIVTISGIDSGDTNIFLDLSPADWNKGLSVRVRQEIEALTASDTSAYLGEEITVKVESYGTPLKNEYAAELSGNGFAIVKQEYDEIVLRANSVGEAKLTVTDTFGTSKEIVVKASSMASGLSADHVELADGVAQTVQILLAQGGTLPEDIDIRCTDENLQINRSKQNISLMVKKGQYVNTTVQVIVDGVEYPLHVTTADRLEQVSVWYAKNGELQKRDKWTKLEDMPLNGSKLFCFSSGEAQDGCLIFVPESLSGSMEKMQSAGGLSADAKQGVYYVRLDAAAYKAQGAAPLTVSLGNTKVSASVYTGDLVTNLGAVRADLAGNLQAGKDVQSALKFYEGASVQKCEVRNAKVATASCSNGVLKVTGHDSGETVISLTMAPTGEVIEIPVTVRQQAERLTADSTTAYVGEEIRISVGSAGAPVAGEFTYSLDNTFFSIRKKENGAVTVQANQYGTSKLTVKDSLGNSQEITLKAETVVMGLNTEGVTLIDGEKQEITFVTSAGKKPAEKPTILENIDGLITGCYNDKIVLRTERGDYVTGTLKFELEGKTYQVKVNTQDRITACSVKHPDASDIGYEALVKKGTLYLNVQTLSGKLDNVSVSGLWKITDAKNGVLTLETTGDVKKLVDTQKLHVLIGGQRVQEFNVDYPNVLLNVPDAVVAREVNEAVSLTVGKDGFDTLFGTLEDVTFTADGLTVTQENNKTLSIVRNTAGTGTLTLKEKNGRTFTVKVPFDAYLKSATVNGTTVNAGSSTTLNLIEGDSATVTLNITGGGRDQLKGFTSQPADANCVQISGSGASLTLTARMPGNTRVTLSDQYGSIVLNVNVAELWKFPNNASTEDEIREVSTALRAMGYQTGRTSKDWNVDVQNGVIAWKKAKGYSGGATLSEAEYAELLTEGGVAVQKASATATPAPAFNPRTGEHAVLKDIAAGLNEIYLLDNKGWVVVMSKNGDVLDAFPAEGGVSYTTLFDTGDIPMAEDSAQMYLLNNHSLEKIISMYKHRNSNTYLYNMMTGLQGEKTSKMAAMSQDSMIIVLPEAQSFFAGSILQMNAGQAVYSLDGSELAPLYVNSGTLLSRIGAIALDNSTFAIATTDNRLYLFGASNGVTQHFGLNTGRNPVSVTITVDGKQVQQRVDQIALSDKNIALRMADGSVLVSGQGVPGQMGELLRERDTFVQCSLNGRAKDIALSDTTLYMLTEDGRLIAWGKGSSAHCTQLLSGIAAISADDTHGYAITTDGKVYRIDGCSADQMTNQVKLP